MEKMSEQEPETVARRGEKLYSERGDFQGRSGLPNGVSRNRDVGSVTRWRGGGGWYSAIRIPQQTKKALSDTCKKTKEVTGQEHFYTEPVDNLNRKQKMERKVYFIELDLCFEQ